MRTSSYLRSVRNCERSTSSSPTFFCSVSVKMRPCARRSPPCCRSPQSSFLQTDTRETNFFFSLQTGITQFANWNPVCKLDKSRAESINWTFKTTSMQTGSLSLQNGPVRRLGPTHIYIPLFLLPLYGGSKLLSILYRCSLHTEHFRSSFYSTVSTLLQTARSHFTPKDFVHRVLLIFLRQRLQATCTQYSSQYLRAASDERRAPAGGTGLSLAVCMS